MHQQKQDESKKDEGVCGPAEVIFVKDTFLKEQIDKKRFNDRDDFGAENSFYCRLDCGKKPLKRTYWSRGRVQLLREPER